ncbi:YgiT-type zinc finger protein [Desulfonema magnum]|uniref:Zinc finger domain-containing protein n=1 Tax=Desulfonema magnum TaxID=45655 RepID=A0A975BKH3_9BACT|nr:YgiT-type zinc finger protein [Desulfonema magnum]QTA87166.1 Zinc finger domain-containing protein [Desulfonema magnum]
MNCAACNNEMIRKKGSIDLRIGEKLYFVRNVMYEECSVCGEKILSPEVSQQLFEKIRNKQFVEETFKFPVLDCAYA